MDLSKYSTEKPIALVIKKHDAKFRDALLDQQCKLMNVGDTEARININDQSVHDVIFCLTLRRTEFDCSYRYLFRATAMNLYGFFFIIVQFINRRRRGSWNIQLHTLSSTTTSLSHITTGRCYWRSVKKSWMLTLGRTLHGAQLIWTSTLRWS